MIGASTFHDFFEAKVDAIRVSTSDADLPTFHPAPAGCELSVFSPVNDVVTDTGQCISACTIRRLSDKQCDADLLPTWLFKLCADELTPFLCRLFNRSFIDGVVPR